ncbi:MAG: hypothetical protein IT252_02715 [Chitinophagaceae bacterium]|nr:hypothetical protein [Chitinophagaceae bacterium]
MFYWNEFRSWSLTKQIGAILIVAGTLIGLWVIFAGGYLALSFTPDETKAKSIQPFMTGLVAPLFTLGSALLVLENLRLNSQQNLSNNFFKLLDFHHKLVDGISTTVTGISGAPIEDQQPNTAGYPAMPASSEKRGFFDDLAERIATDFADNTNAYTGLAIQAKTNKEKLVQLYRCYFNVHQSDLGHYVRHFQRIMEFLQHARFERRNREDMLALFKTQLSNYELLLLAYHGIAYENSGLATILENNQFLEHLNPEHEADNHGMMQRIIGDRNVLREAYSHLATVQGF